MKRDPATAQSGDDVILHLNDALRSICFTSLEKVNARAFSHIDSESSLLGLSFIDQNSTHKDGPNRFTPPIAHRSHAAPGDAYWAWPEEDDAERAAQREANRLLRAADYEHIGRFGAAVVAEFEACNGYAADFGFLSEEDFGDMTVEDAAKHLQALVEADRIMEQAEAENAAMAPPPRAERRRMMRQLKKKLPAKGKSAKRKATSPSPKKRSRKKKAR